MAYHPAKNNKEKVACFIRDKWHCKGKGAKGDGIFFIAIKIDAQILIIGIVSFDFGKIFKNTELRFVHHVIVVPVIVWQVLSKNYKRLQSRKSHSWWWDSHISLKNSKWLIENLEEQ
ncbi:hypothetical protein SADUNF_Sadunf13G0123600 [Salix dunnii]|uniref:Uncharacterized protein n=1 Tax=Salix dunnii TaxID=1413687 RepID=A0A835JJQ1_9ROSI|nr:hypothetical protein SADUNF_Sadunf13G0123600 [Salix dunnii]